MIKQNITDIIERLRLQPINEVGAIDRFYNEYDEYNIFLHDEASNYELLSISRTHLLVDVHTGDILAYMALVADSVQLSKSEKELKEMGLIPFSTFPALKIGKLAVDYNAKQKYYGIGSLMLRLARGFASDMNDNGVACRFLTIDADVENNPDVTGFYIKNGFTYNERINNKNRLTISMRKDIFITETD